MPSPRKVLFVNHDSVLPGGANVVLLNILRRLPRDKFDPHVLLPATGPLLEALKEENISHSIIPAEYMWLPNTKRIVAAARKLAKRMNELESLISNGGFSLVHVNTVFPLDAMLVAATAGLPVLVHAHESIDNPLERHALFESLGASREFVRSVIHSSATSVVCVSPHAAESLRNGPPYLIVEQLLSGIDLDAFDRAQSGASRELHKLLDAQPDDLSLISVGRICHSKGFEHLINALELARAQGGKLRLAIVGPEEDVELAGNLRSQIARKGLEKWARILGRQENVERLISDADFAVVSSIYEGQSLFALEAMSAGKAVIATRCHGPENMIDNEKNGILVPPADPYALANAMLRLAVSPDLRQRLGGAARKKVESHLDLDSQVHDLQTIYERTLISGYRPKPHLLTEMLRMAASQRADLGEQVLALDARLREVESLSASIRNAIPVRIASRLRKALIGR